MKPSRRGQMAPVVRACYSLLTVVFRSGVGCVAPRRNKDRPIGADSPRNPKNIFAAIFPFKIKSVTF
jgi:hypothetical protein